MEQIADTQIEKIHTRQKLYFESGKTRTFEARKQLLKELGERIQAHEQEIYAALKSDLGKSEMEAYMTEVGFIQADISHALKNLRRWMMPQWAATGLINFPGKSSIIKEPYGSVLNIAPWNYPFQLALAPAIGALAAGNTVLIKPSEMAPATAAVIKKLINSHFDPGVLYVMEGGVEATTALLQQKWDYIFFTGSSSVGKIVYKSAAEHLTPVTLELGGKSPTIVHASANLKISARRIVWGKFLNAGQTCVAPDYVLVDQRIKDKFIPLLQAEIESFYGKNPIQNEEYGKIIHEKHFDRLEKYTQDARILYGGASDRNSCKIAPVIVEPKDMNSPLMQDEIFGPILPIVPFSSAGEVVSIIRSKAKPLALYIFSSDSDFTQYILDHTSSGGVSINDVIMHMAGSELPFGGVGESGLGAYHGKYSFDTFSHQKPVLHRQFWLDAPLRYPPFNKIPLAWLKKIFRHVL